MGNMSHFRGRAEVAALLLSPPEPHSYPHNLREAPVFSGAQTWGQAPGTHWEMLRRTSDSYRGTSVPGPRQTSREEYNMLPNIHVPVYHNPF